MGEFYKMFRKELTPTFLKSFQNFAEEGIFTSSFSEAIITLIPKPDKHTTQKRKEQAHITGEHRCINPQKKYKLKKILFIII